MSETVLVACADVPTIKRLRKKLSKRKKGAQGPNVIFARKGKQVIRKAMSAVVDLVLIDINMPDLDGMELIRGIQEAHKASLEVRLLASAQQVVYELEQIMSPMHAMVQSLQHLGLAKRDLSRLASLMQRLEREASKPHDAIQTLADAIVGKRFSPGETARFEIGSLVDYFKERRRLFSNALTAPRVAELLGTSRQTPHDRLRAGLLIAEREDGKMLFPIWQFDPGGPDGVVSGLPETLRALRGPPLVKMRWLTTANKTLENRTPIEVLRDGDVERVVDEASAVGIV